MSLFIAAQTAFVEFGDKRVKIVKDLTVARAGHAILAGNEHLFKPLHVHYDVEKPKPPVAKPAAAKAVQVKPAVAAVTTQETDKEE